MTQEANQSALHSWWEELSFPGKEHYQLGDKGTLTLKAADKERTIANLTEGNAAATFKSLSEKFSELKTRVSELKTEWDKNEDRSKLVGKVERLRENILHANAIGDLNSLSQQVSEWDKVIHEMAEENYQARLKLVQQSEELANAENFKETNQALRDLTEKWKQIGYTDKHRSDELWNRMEEARNKFHERKRKHQEDHEKDMLQNLDLKMELVEKAEQHTNSETWKETTEIYKQLMEQWKATGHTMHDKNEELWKRFSDAKNNFFDRKKAHGDRIHTEQEANYIAKLALVEKAETLKDSTEWNNTVQAFAELMEEWKKIGRVPQEKSDEIWNRLNAAKDHFFNAKRAHFEVRNVELENNYIQKNALVQRAHAIKNSSNWRDVTDEMNELMEEWKQIGPVPQKKNQEIWDEFNAARKHFFKRKDENRERNKQQIEKKKSQFTSNTRGFLHKLEEELRDEEQKITDFRNDLENMTPGPKEKELRAHLTNLITETEAGIGHKKEKIEKVRKELEQLETKHTKGESKHHHHPAEKEVSHEEIDTETEKPAE